MSKAEIMSQTEKKSQAGKKNQAEIKAIFEQFIRSMRENDFDPVTPFLDEDAELDFSTVGKAFGKAGLIEKLRWKEFPFNVSRAKAGNTVIRAAEKKAAAMAYVYFLYAIDEKKQFYPFEYGGKLLLELADRNGWKIVKACFDLDWETGNTYFAKDWNLMNQSIPFGHRPCIDLDTVFPARADYMQEEDDRGKLRELIARYTMGEDYGRFDILESTVDEGIISAMPHGTAVQGRKAFMEYAKSVRGREASFEHLIEIRSVTIEGDTAHLVGYRIEPHRLNHYLMVRENLDKRFYSAIYTMDLHKAHGDWYLNRIIYDRKYFYEKDDLDTIWID